VRAARKKKLELRKGIQKDANRSLFDTLLYADHGLGLLCSSGPGLEYNVIEGDRLNSEWVLIPSPLTWRWNFTAGIDIILLVETVYMHDTSVYICMSKHGTGKSKEKDRRQSIDSITSWFFEKNGQKVRFWTFLTGLKFLKQEIFCFDGDPF